MEKCNNSVFYEPISKVITLIIISHKLEAICVDFVAH